MRSALRRCVNCGHDYLVTFSCKRRGLQSVVRRAAHGAGRGAPGRPRDPYVSVRQWVLALTIPMRLLLSVPLSSDESLDRYFSFGS